jgi:Putative  PD-(D/E)XK family member, (DUF4420)
MTLEVQSLEELFRELLNQRGDAGTINAKKLESEGLFAAVNDAGDYLVLVDDQRLSIGPPMRLKVLSVDYGIKYKAIIDDAEVSGQYTVLRLGSQHPHLTFSFCALISMLSSSLGTHPTPGELQEFVENFIELFAPRSGNPRERIKGLFGELAVINAADDKENFAHAWHNQTNANKDFSFPLQYLEVKTTEGKVRKHEFSSKQLDSPFEGKPVLVASLVIEEDPQGQTVFQLLDSVQSNLSHEMQVKLIKQTFEIVGLDAEDAQELKWSVQGSSGGIYIFPAEELPKPIVDNANDLSAAISGIGFSLNFEILEAAGMAHRQLGEFNWQTAVN